MPRDGRLEFLLERIQRWTDISMYVRCCTILLQHTRLLLEQKLFHVGHGPGVRSEVST